MDKHVTSPPHEYLLASTVIISNPPSDNSGYGPACDHPIATRKTSGYLYKNNAIYITNVSNPLFMIMITVKHVSLSQFLSEHVLFP